MKNDRSLARKRHSRRQGKATTNSLRGKTAIVTGASRGIGLAIATVLAREGVKLALISRTPPPPGLDEAFLECDLADPARIPDAVARALGQLGGLDFLVNNAGIFLEKSVPKISLADWEKTLRVNLTAPFLICRQTLPHLAARKGRIVNIVSSSAMQGYLHQSAYVASKHGLLGFARALALEARPRGVHVYNLCPGGVDTGLLQGTELGARLKGQPMIRPADLAEMVAFLLRQPANVDLPEIAIRRFV
ncbi:MAG: SDR family oxidoreductase [Verrucomicrobiota bacterium]|nr:SDR family oxidoreductase [Verrucomicrobiota bacterium]